MKRSNRLPRYPIGPMTGKLIQQLEDQSQPSSNQLGQAQLHHASSSQAQSHPSSTQAHPPQPTSSHTQPQPRSSQSQLSQQHVSADAGSSGFGIDRKKTRGPTLCFKLWSMPDGQRFIVEFNENGEPIGNNAPKLTNFLGTIARNGVKAPLTFNNWKAMPDTYKEDMWRAIQAKFDIDPCHMEWIFKSLSKKWKDWKAELKAKHYCPYETDEERLADRDNRVEPDQWPILLSFWNSDEGKERSTTNKANRAKQKISHTAGSKSFARVFNEQKNKMPAGEEPSRIDIFIKTHTHNGGKAVDEASAEVISQLQERASKLPENKKDCLARDDIFSQVMGKHGHDRVRSFGMGRSPSNLWGPKSSRYAAMRSASEASRLAVERERQMQEQLEEMQQKHQEQVDNMHIKYEDMAEKYAELQAQVSMITSNMPSRLSNEQIANVVDGPSKPLGTKQVPHMSNTPKNSPNQRVRPSSSSQPVASHERQPSKRGKVQHMSTSRVGDEVLLKSFNMPKVTVAKGTLMSVDSSTKVGGSELGPNFWEVSVEVAVLCQTHLIRTRGRLKTIGDAVGSTIAWPAKDVVADIGDKD